MIRRVGIVALLLTSAVSCGPRREPAGDVILVTLDTTRADRIGAYGYELAATPVLDGLAASGVLFEQAACQVPITTPSHTSILTGLLPTEHGVRINGAAPLRDDVVTLAERLGPLGYRSHAILASFAVDRQFGLDQGFDSYDDEISDSQTEDPGAERSADDVIDRAIRWLRRTPQKTFLWAHLYDAHFPWQPAPPFDVPFAERPYDGEIAFLDRELGRLFAELEAQGRLDAALVIVVADHGEGLGEHGEAYHGTLVFDTTMHIPLIVKWPGRGPRGRVTTSVATYDLVPTVLAALGAAADPALPGRDLWDFAAGDEEPGREVYLESMSAELHYGWARVTALRTERHKLIHAVEPALYEHAADPGEEVDIAAEEPELTDAMVARLEGIVEQEVVAEVERGERSPESAAQLQALGYLSAVGSSEGARQLDPHQLMAVEAIAVEALEAVEKDPARAIELFEKTLEMEPGMKASLVQLARLEASRGDRLKAIDYHQRVLERYKDVEDSRLNLVRLLAEVGRMPEARAEAEKALEADPESPRPRLLVATLEQMEGRHDRARELLQEVPDGGHNGARRDFILAMVEAREGNDDRALALLEKAVAGGYPKEQQLVAAEPSFAAFRDRPEFLILVEEMRRKAR